MKFIYNGRVVYKDKQWKHHRVGLWAVGYNHNTTHIYMFNGKDHRINGFYYTNIKCNVLYNFGIKVNVSKLVI